MSNCGVYASKISYTKDIGQEMPSISEENSGIPPPPKPKALLQ